MGIGIFRQRKGADAACEDQGQCSRHPARLGLRHGGRGNKA
jgi:hypothetical protein